MDRIYLRLRPAKDRFSKLSNWLLLDEVSISLLGDSELFYTGILHDFCNNGGSYATLLFLKESKLVGWKAFPPDFNFFGISRSKDLMAAFE